MRWSHLRSACVVGRFFAEIELDYARRQWRWSVNDKSVEVASGYSGSWDSAAKIAEAAIQRLNADGSCSGGACYAA